MNLGDLSQVFITQIESGGVVMKEDKQTRENQEKQNPQAPLSPQHQALAALLQQPRPPPQAACNNTQSAPQQGMSHEAVAALLQQLNGRVNHVTEQQQQQQQQHLSQQQRSPLSVDQLASLMMQMPTAQRPMAAEEQSRSMAQANNPSPGSFLWYHGALLQCLAFQSVMHLSTVLSLCDGAGCADMALKKVDGSVGKYYAVEEDEVAKRICQHANLVSGAFPGVTHDWHSDVFDITEQSIIDISHVHLLCYGAPCKDLSKLRLLMSKARADKLKAEGVNPRPGLDGPHGLVFRQCLLMTVWAPKHNPQREVFVEQVDFSDLLAHWDEVCAALGVPFMFSVEEVSFTNRFRCYWASFRSAVPADMFMDMQRHPDPHQCMGPGRTLEKYSSHGKDHVRPIAASWLGGNSPRANTMRSVLVRDVAHADVQQLTPVEAELLMGWECDCTAEPTVTAAQRLTAIGGGWDPNAVHSMLYFASTGCLM